MHTVLLPDDLWQQAVDPLSAVTVTTLSLSLKTGRDCCLHCCSVSNVIPTSGIETSDLPEHHTEALLSFSHIHLIQLCL